MIEYKKANEIKKMMNQFIDKDNFIIEFKKQINIINNIDLTKDNLSLLALVLLNINNEEKNYKNYIKIIEILLEKDFKLTTEEEIYEITFNLEYILDFFIKEDREDLFKKLFYKEDSILSFPILDKINFLEKININFNNIENIDCLFQVTFPNLLNQKEEDIEEYILKLSKISSLIVTLNKNNENDLLKQISSRDTFIKFVYHIGGFCNQLYKYKKEWNIFKMNFEKYYLELKNENTSINNKKLRL